ncbi:hypothetical protein [Muribaculum gordoncarteri]|uniref:hypothetical protein n=1 Tax=Muribaculum gordoncarteri TaxID=2530390 RepID=UPI003F678E69
MAALAVVVTIFTFIANVVVERSTRDRIYDNIDALPHNRGGPTARNFRRLTVTAHLTPTSPIASIPQ